MMKYVISALMGLIAGALYSISGVQSPAPPGIALLGLLGMLIGEQIVPAVRRKLSGKPLTADWFTSQCIPNITGAPPSDAPEKRPMDGQR
jgi:XapX domain-containing protein